MMTAMLRIALSSLVLAAGPLAAIAYGQTPPAAVEHNGIWESGSTSSSHSNSVTSVPATVAPASIDNTGASSWSAGRGSFGVQRTIPRSNLDFNNRNSRSAAPASGSSSWTAGRGNFGLNVHQNGIWRAPAGGTPMPGGRSSVRPAHGLHTPSPNFAGRPSAVASPGMATPTPLAVAPHVLAGARGSQTRLVTSGRPSKTPHGSLSGRAGSKSIPKAPRGRTYQSGRNSLTIGSGQKTSQFGATGQTPLSGAAEGSSAMPAPQQ